MFADDCDQSHVFDCSPEEEPGRLLDDREYSQALGKREDIFSIASEAGPRIAVAVALAVAVIVGLFANVIHPPTVSPDVLERHHGLISATLLNNSQQSEPVSVQPLESKTRIVRYALGKHQEPTNTRAATTAPLVFAHRKAAPDSLLAIGRVRARPAESAVMSVETVPVRAVSHDTVTSEEKSIIEEGITLERQGKHTDAINAFKKVILHDPGNSHALGGIGDVFLHIGFLDSAEIFYKSALASNPKNPEVHNGLGSVNYYLSDMAANVHWAQRMNIANPAQYIKEQFEAAIVEYTKAFSLDSTYVEALTNRGVLRDIHGQPDSAIKDYSLAIRINPSYADAYCKRAEVFKEDGRYHDAIADYTAAIGMGGKSYKFDPPLHFANAYFGRGLILHQIGQVDSAIADFDSCISLEPYHSIAILNRAICFSDKRLLDSAIAGYTKAIAMLSPLEYNGSQGLAFLHRGTAYKNLGKYDAAIADYTKSLGFPRLQQRSCWRIAQCYCLKRDKPNALSWLSKAVSYGFTDFASWKRDKDLSDLWHDKEFLELVGKGKGN